MPASGAVCVVYFSHSYHQCPIFFSPSPQGINESANSLPAETVRHIWLPPRMSVISCFLPRPAETSVHEKWLPAETQQSRQEARDRGQSRRKPNMTDSLCRKSKLADSFIPCVLFERPCYMTEILSQRKPKTTIQLSNTN